jgi:hypothetical protein
VASLAMLGGLVRCAGCGHTLKIAGGTVKKTGERYAVYYCTGRYAKGPCPARATIRASYLDSYVEQTVLTALQSEDGFLAEAVEATEKLVEARRTLKQAEHELALYLQTDLISTVGQEPFLTGVSARQANIDEARALVERMRAESAIAEELTSGELLSAWPELTTQERRTLLHGLLERVVLHHDENSRRKAFAQPFDKRVQIILRGGVRLVLPLQPQDHLSP